MSNWPNARRMVYRMEIHNGDVRYYVVLSAQDGSLMGLTSKLAQRVATESACRGCDYPACHPGLGRP